MLRFPAHTLELPYSPPYDWENVLAFFRAHRLPHIEVVDDSGYERVIRAGRGLGWFRVEQQKNRDALLLSLWNGSEKDAARVSQSVRRMFDLDANPATVLRAMTADNLLSAFWAQHPGLRLARSWDAFESIFTTVLGQVVSVSFGRLLIDELMQAAGSPAVHPKTTQPISLFPSARQILEADLSKVRTSRARRATIRSVAQVIDDGTLNLTTLLIPEVLRKVLSSIPGVGAWTTEYLALRAFGDDNAFPSTDYALKQELKRHPEIRLDSVQPFRGYAAIALWKSFAESRKVPLNGSLLQQL
ncbi:DNA-3-methyladenine glycosylase family protein [Occallatibacter savannae]|uniref:DNA-3-methyladenine glycosylase family protein n=1 Tax=Occallatibacter savannae TaxID=1002691 RepID=UPI000D68B499|nr:AlkA N-terminal domain-containing protein [Occallatibacter savannae]